MCKGSERRKEGKEEGYKDIKEGRITANRSAILEKSSMGRYGLHVQTTYVVIKLGGLVDKFRTHTRCSVTA